MYYSNSGRRINALKEKLNITICKPNCYWDDLFNSLCDKHNLPNRKDSADEFLKGQVLGDNEYEVNEPIICEILQCHCCKDSYLFLDYFQYTLHYYGNSAVHKSYLERGFSFIEGVPYDGRGTLILYYQCTTKNNIDEYLKVEKELHKMRRRAEFIKVYLKKKQEKKKFVFSRKKRKILAANAALDDEYYNAICVTDWNREMANQIEKLKELQVDRMK